MGGEDGAASIWTHNSDPYLPPNSNDTWLERRGKELVNAAVDKGRAAKREGVRQYNRLEAGIMSIPAPTPASPMSPPTSGSSGYSGSSGSSYVQPGVSHSQVLNTLSKWSGPLHQVDLGLRGHGAYVEITGGAFLFLYGPTPAIRIAGLFAFAHGVTELIPVLSEWLTGVPQPSLTVAALTRIQVEAGVDPKTAELWAEGANAVLSLALQALTGNPSRIVTQGGLRVAIHDLLPRLGPIGKALHDPLASVAYWAGYIVCFAGGTPIRTPDGSRAIEDIQPGDLVLSRNEYNPDGAVEPKVVEEVFARYGLVWELRVGGQVIRTTAEHPFYAWGKGWTASNLLTVGDTVLTEDGRWVAVEVSRDTGETEPVYNFRVADYHTYFVGCQEWKFSVWSHNSRCAVPGKGSAVEQGLTRGIEYENVAKDFDAARRFARELSGLGEDSIDALGKMRYDYKKIIGRQSPDGLRGWRLDWDPNNPTKGFHINWWDKSANLGDRKQWLQGYIRIENGNYNQYLDLMEHALGNRPWQLIPKP
ncbi:putative hemagglutinin-related protein [Fimbriiglobus ruber]|uniref:Putative hemagglutinin-related protein n=1 Tax=Fimbriiglobus ruber TaxID=1908690 RepID=A0A225DTT4_9BACT|nr:putative hemagglutinin-related protein [Fimbriiglobus ruber]